MAYEPINWQTGDIITAERLNRMDRGWDVEMTELFSETVTTAVDTSTGDNSAKLTYSGTIDADIITVTYDGTEYACPRIDAFSSHFYGGFSEQGPTFTEYPFSIWSGSMGNRLVTQTAGEHTVAAATSSLQTSADFDKARGWGYATSAPTEVFNETVTAAEQGGTYSANLAYSQLIDAYTIIVTYDGTEYTCPRIDMNDNLFYGGVGAQGPDFTEYPFLLASSDSHGNAVYTETAGTHTINVIVSNTSIQTSTDFDSAVSSVFGTFSIPFRCVSGQTNYFAMIDAQNAGRLMYFQFAKKTYFIHTILDMTEKVVKFFPENTNLRINFVNDVFTVTGLQ